MPPVEKRTFPEPGGLPRRQYRIPIKAALNGTAGAHTLKVVISPAEATANLRAAEYGYGVPGLTQPGEPSSACALEKLIHRALRSEECKDLPPRIISLP